MVQFITQLLEGGINLCKVNDPSGVDIRLAPQEYFRLKRMSMQTGIGMAIRDIAGKMMRSIKIEDFINFHATVIIVDMQAREYRTFYGPATFFVAAGC